MSKHDPNQHRHQSQQCGHSTGNLAGNQEENKQNNPQHGGNDANQNIEKQRLHRVKSHEPAVFFNQEENQPRTQPNTYDSKAAMFSSSPVLDLLGLFGQAAWGDLDGRRVLHYKFLLLERV